MTVIQIPVTVNVSPTTVTVSVGASTTTIAVPAAPPVVIPPIVPPTSGARWVYQNGVRDPAFDADWSFGGTANYKDTTGAPQGGVADILFTGSIYNAGWQPAISKCQTNKASCLDTTQYGFYLLSTKPTVANQQWQVGFMSSGDTPDGPVVDITPYGPAAQVGVWGSYKIPLSAFKLTDTSILKFWVQGNTNGALHWWMDNIGFSAT